jgi:hypothetical protein
MAQVDPGQELEINKRPWTCEFNENQHGFPSFASFHLPVAFLQDTCAPDNNCDRLKYPKSSYKSHKDHFISYSDQPEPPENNCTVLSESPKFVYGYFISKDAKNLPADKVYYVYPNAGGLRYEMKNVTEIKLSLKFEKLVYTLSLVDPLRNNYFKEYNPSLLYETHVVMPFVPGSSTYTISEYYYIMRFTEEYLNKYKELSLLNFRDHYEITEMLKCTDFCIIYIFASKEERDQKLKVNL